MKIKKTLSAILLGAGLIFGAGNKINAQEYQTYNNDEDEFQEEIICYKAEEVPDKKYNLKRYTIIYYSDKDNDDFYENIKVFNFDPLKISGVLFNIEDFYIDKSTGLINYNHEQCFTFKKKYFENYSNKLLTDIVKMNSHETFNHDNICSGRNLTKEKIYSLYPRYVSFFNSKNYSYFPGTWNSYNEFGERVKKIINASGNEAELKKLVSNERDLWGNTYSK